MNADVFQKIVWEEMLKRFERIEVVGEPKRVYSSFVRGIEQRVFGRPFGLADRRSRVAAQDKSLNNAIDARIEQPGLARRASAYTLKIVDCDLR